MKVKNKYRDSQAKVFQLGKFNTIELNEGDNICDCYGGTKRDYDGLFKVCTDAIHNFMLHHDEAEKYKASKVE